MMKNPKSVVRGLMILVLAAAGAGCLQIETRVKLNPDGSATVTERVLFTRRLLDLSNKEGRNGFRKRRYRRDWRSY